MNYDEGAVAAMVSSLSPLLPSFFSNINMCNVVSDSLVENGPLVLGFSPNCLGVGD